MTMMGLSWEEQTIARLKTAKERLEHAKQDFERWGAYVHALEIALELDRQTRPVPVNGQQKYDPEILRLKSIRESLIEIGARNNGVIVAKEAVKILVEMGVYTDVKQSRDTVYSVLRRSKKDFKKERAGVYLLIRQQPIPLQLAP